MNLTLRLATAADLAAINAIYNHYVMSSTCTYQEEPSTEAERAAWFAEHQASGGMHPVTVAADDTNAIVGWASLSRFHPRCAYRHTVEDSVYVAASRQRQGIGRALLADLLGRAKALGHRQVIALISADQAPSVALHRSLGFVDAGLLKGVGEKFGRTLDVLYMQYRV